MRGVTLHSVVEKGQVPRVTAISDEQIYYERITTGLSKPTTPIKVIDLFCGAGGLTAGFTQFSGHHFTPVLAIDNDPAAIATYNANFPGNHGKTADLHEFLNIEPSAIPLDDVVIGGPPCQGFSTLNRERGVHDERRQMWRPYMEVVKRSGASVFVIENVPQLIDSPEFVEIKQYAEGLGFNLAAFKLLASDYGAPQARKRAVIIGSNRVSIQQMSLPKKTHYDPDRIHKAHDYISLIEPQPWQTVRNAISDLPEPVGSEIQNTPPPIDLHFGRNPTELSLKRYKVIPEGGNRFDLERNAPELNLECWKKLPTGRTDLFGRLHWDRPSVTIRTEFFKPEKGRYLHPVQHRPITHREAARIQGFPDNFRFTGSKLQIARQIGNAVPVQLAARIADYVLAIKLLEKQCSVR